MANFILPDAWAKNLGAILDFFFFLSHPISNLSANPLGIPRAFLHFSPPPPLSQGLGPPSFLAGLMAVAS